MDFLVENKLYIGAILGVIAMLWPRLATGLSKVKSMFKSKDLKNPTLIEVSFELEDQAAIRHLRKRAVFIGDKELITMVKDIDGKFYDVHSGVTK